MQTRVRYINRTCPDVWKLILAHYNYIEAAGGPRECPSSFCPRPVSRRRSFYIHIIIYIMFNARNKDAYKVFASFATNPISRRGIEQIFQIQYTLRVFIYIHIILCYAMYKTTSLSGTHIRIKIYI